LSKDEQARAGKFKFDTDRRLFIVTHAALRKECGGPAAAVATAGQLQERIDKLREMATKKSS